MKTKIVSLLLLLLSLCLLLLVASCSSQPPKEILKNSGSGIFGHCALERMASLIAVNSATIGGGFIALFQRNNAGGPCQVDKDHGKISVLTYFAIFIVAFVLLMWFVLWKYKSKD
jgi:hypothetical protein